MLASCELDEGDARYGIVGDEGDITLISDEPFAAWEPGETGIATWVADHNEPVLVEDQAASEAGCGDAIPKEPSGG